MLVVSLLSASDVLSLIVQLFLSVKLYLLHSSIYARDCFSIERQPQKRYAVAQKETKTGYNREGIQRGERKTSEFIDGLRNKEYGVRF